MNNPANDPQVTTTDIKARGRQQTQPNPTSVQTGHQAEAVCIPASDSRSFHRLEAFLGKLMNTHVSVTLAVLAASSTGWNRKASNRYGG